MRAASSSQCSSFPEVNNMKSIILFTALLAYCLAGPIGEVEFSQDSHGNYLLKYDTEDASRDEHRFEDGRVIGTFSFVDTDGHKHTIKYYAAADEGFNAVGPSVPVEGDDIVRSRAEHLRIFDAIKRQGFIEEKKVPVKYVLERLAPPEFRDLPSISVPRVDHEHLEQREVLLGAYEDALHRLAQEYKNAEHRLR